MAEITLTHAAVTVRVAKRDNPARMRELFAALPRITFEAARHSDPLWELAFVVLARELQKRPVLLVTGRRRKVSTAEEVSRMPTGHITNRRTSSLTMRPTLSLGHDAECGC